MQFKRSKPNSDLAPSVSKFDISNKVPGCLHMRICLALLSLDQGRGLHSTSGYSAKWPAKRYILLVCLTSAGGGLAVRPSSGTTNGLLSKMLVNVKLHELFQEDSGWEGGHDLELTSAALHTYPNATVYSLVVEFGKLQAYEPLVGLEQLSVKPSLVQLLSTTMNSYFW